MFNEAISLVSLVWTFMNSWFRPTFLFLLLNLMIGTIFIISTFASSKTQNYQKHLNTVFHQHQHQYQHELTRAPTILERLKTINFYSYHTQVDQLGHQNLPADQSAFFPVSASEQKSGKFLVKTESQTQTQTQTQTQQTQTPTIEEDTLLQDDEGPTLEEIYYKIKSTSSIHYNRQNSDTKPVGGEIPVKLPAKLKKSASHKSAFNHFQTVYEPKNVANTTTGDGREVDARADDFINRFKKQLQLQRIESILRYKEMLTKGRG